MNKRLLGTEGEEKAVQFLMKNGFSIVEMNYTCKIGEIDIIAKDSEALVFIEVKWRKNIKMGRPYEAVDYHKQMKIMKSAMLYAQEKGLYETSMRFDVIEIIDEEILWIKNAFMMKTNLRYL